MLRQTTTALAFALLLIACATVSASEDGDSDALVITRAERNRVSPESPCGWIYAFEQPDGQPDLCTYMWPDGTWTLCAETTPGYFGSRLASGPINEGVAVGFPVEVLRSSGNLCVAGRVSATADGVPIRRGIDAPRPSGGR